MSNIHCCSRFVTSFNRLFTWSNQHQDLLKDVTKNSDDESAKADLTAGIASAERILKKANDAVERNVLDEALEELIGRVDDWKNHKVEQFGRLLQHGVYTVITGRSDQEKDVGPVSVRMFRLVEDMQN